MPEKEKPKIIKPEPEPEAPDYDDDYKERLEKEYQREFMERWER